MEEVIVGMNMNVQSVDSIVNEVRVISVLIVEQICGKETDDE